MAQPPITLSDGTTVLQLDPDLHWADEFKWSAIEQSTKRGLTGALIIQIGKKVAGRAITLEPPSDDAAWMPRATLDQLQAWEADPAVSLTLTLRGTAYAVAFDRGQGAAIEAHPVEFVADPLPNGMGDWYLTTLRFLTTA